MLRNLNGISPVCKILVYGKTYHKRSKKMDALAYFDGGAAMNGGTKQQPNIVDRAIDACGGSMTMLAERLERISGQKCTKQKVWNWRERGQIPADWVVHVHSVTRIPLKELLSRSRPRGGPAD